MARAFFFCEAVVRTVRAVPCFGSFFLAVSSVVPVASVVSVAPVVVVSPDVFVVDVVAAVDDVAATDDVLTAADDVVAATDGVAATDSVPAAVVDVVAADVVASVTAIFCCDDFMFLVVGISAIRLQNGLPPAIRLLDVPTVFLQQSGSKDHDERCGLPFGERGL